MMYCIIAPYTSIINDEDHTIDCISIMEDGDTFSFLTKQKAVS